MSPRISPHPGFVQSVLYWRLFGSMFCKGQSHRAPMLDAAILPTSLQGWV